MTQVDCLAQVQWRTSSFPNGQDPVSTCVEVAALPDRRPQQQPPDAGAVYFTHAEMDA